MWGERLSRLIPARLGARYKIRAVDLETGLLTDWKASVDDPLSLSLKGEKGKESVPGLLIQRREGAARLSGQRRLDPGQPFVQLRSVTPTFARLTLRAPSFLAGVPDPNGPVGTLLRFLRAIARGDRTEICQTLDFDALHQAINGKPQDRQIFEQVLLERLSRVDWLRSQGLALPADGCAAEDFLLERTGFHARVRLRSAQELVFELKRRKRCQGLAVGGFAPS